MDVSENVERQRQLYGAPLGECLQRITGALGLSQAAVARTVGLSAPMLSQLASGRRIKIGNPQVASRFTAMLGLVDDVEAGLPRGAVAERLEQIAGDHAPSMTTRTAATRSSSLGSSGSAGSAGPGAVDVPSAVAGVLRAVASGRELAAAADLLHAAHPDLAEVLRVYGTGSPEDAGRHHRSISHLL